MHERYVDLVAQITAWAEAEPDIDGLILIGSQARAEPPADRWSDADLMVFAQTPSRWLGTSAWLERWGTPLAVFTEVTPLGFSDWDWNVRRVLYASGHDVDFSVLRADRAGEVLAVNADIMAHGYQVLVDGTGTLAQDAAAIVADVRSRAPADKVPADAGATRQENARLTEAVQVLLYHVIWAQKKIARGEVWVGAGCLNAFMRPYLLALVEAYSQTRGLPAGALAYEGRFLEGLTPPDALALLRPCGSRYDAGEATVALGAVLDLVEALAPPVYAVRGLPWDAAALDGIRAIYRALADGQEA